MQDQWEICEKNGQIVQPDDKEAVITQAQHRITMVVQTEADERWKNRMANEDKITTNSIEVLGPVVRRIVRGLYIATGQYSSFCRVRIGFDARRSRHHGG